MSTNTTLHTADAAHTWGMQIAPTLAAGDVIALCGNLGAGKTQITRGIVAGSTGRWGRAEGFEPQAVVQAEVVPMGAATMA